jgi:hypothetical protein
METKKQKTLNFFCEKISFEYISENLGKIINVKIINTHKDNFKDYFILAEKKGKIKFVSVKNERETNINISEVFDDYKKFKKEFEWIAKEYFEPYLNTLNENDFSFKINSHNELLLKQFPSKKELFLLIISGATFPETINNYVKAHDIITCI